MASFAGALCSGWMTAKAADARPLEPKAARRDGASPAIQTAATSSEPLPSEGSTTTWYGWQTLASDGAALTLVVGGGLLAAQSEGGVYVLALGGIAYLVGAPVIHFTHDRVGAGFGSLGMRASFPLLGAVIGANAENCSGEFLCGLAGAFVGFFVGSSAAIAIDASLLAFDEEQPANADYARRSPTTWTLVPNITATHAGASLLGTF